MTANEELFLFSIPLLIPAVFLLWLLVYIARKQTVLDDAKAKGYRDVTVKWDPFGPPGWIFEKNETIFRVTYTDVNNMEHEAFCKTSLSGGVYYGLDTIKGPAENADTSAVRPDPEFSQSPAEAVPSQAEVPFVAHSATGSEENLQEENRRLRLEVEHLRRRLDELEGSRDGRPPVEEA